MSEESSQSNSKGLFILVVVGSVVGTLLCVGCITVAIICIVRTIRPKKGGRVSTAGGPVPVDAKDSDFPLLDDVESEGSKRRGNPYPHAPLYQHHLHHHRDEKRYEEYAKHHDKRQHDDLFKRTREERPDKPRDDRQPDKFRDDHNHLDKPRDERLDKPHDDHLDKSRHGHDRPPRDEHEHLDKHHDRHQRNDSFYRAHEERHHERHHHHH